RFMAGSVIRATDAYQIQNVWGTDLPSQVACGGRAFVVSRHSMRSKDRDLMPHFPYSDIIGGRRVLTVIAAQAEYGPHLRARLTPLICGVGPVESAVAVTAALTRLTQAGHAPDLVLSIGSAG